MADDGYYMPSAREVASCRLRLGLPLDTHIAGACLLFFSFTTARRTFRYAAPMPFCYCVFGLCGNDAPLRCAVLKRMPRRRLQLAAMAGGCAQTAAAAVSAQENVSRQQH